MRKKRKMEKLKMQIPPHSWEGVNDDAEEEGGISFTDNNVLGDGPNAIEDRAANFNPLDEDQFEGNIS